MELISLQFALFLGALVCTYYVVGRFFRDAQWMVLLAGSIAFYSVAGGWSLLIYMLAVALVTWGASLFLARLDDQSKAARKAEKDRAKKKELRKLFDRKRRVIFWTALTITVVILGYFKYWNVLLYYFRVEESIYSLGILLPLGISFYVFQSLSYLIDSYNSKYPPQRNFARYLLFVSYFPQIIQGPINRYNELAPQFFEHHAANINGIQRGILRLGYGILKKVAVANILTNAVNAAFNNSSGPNIPGSIALYGVLVYSIEMYADFSGGIDIVEGASELFGISMAQNFKQPYFAVSLADFWRRWHMSLGTWMRDYVFYPLAVTSPMRRFGKWSRAHFSKHVGRTLPACISNVLVFLLVGLWHGAELHFVVWGLYNGIIVALADLFAPLFERLVERLHIRRESTGFHVFSMVRTFVVVCIGRYFDRFGYVGDAFYALRNIFSSSVLVPLRDALTASGASYASEYGFPLPTIIACVLIFAIDVFYERGTDVRAAVLSWRLPLRIAFYVFVVILIAGAASMDTTNGGGGFLYANF